MVAPYSGAMLAIVARSGSDSAATPGPVNSTNLSTTPFLRSIWVTVSTRSVAVAPGGSWPVSSKPTTSGISIAIGWPSMTASASMPPTPQPNTPRPLTMVVCESVPTSESGYATTTPAAEPGSVNTTLARYSRLTWWQMPVPGGTTFMLANACWPQRRNR